MPQLQRMDYVNFGDGVTGTVLHADPDGSVRAFLSNSLGRLVTVLRVELEKATLIYRHTYMRAGR